MQNFTQMKQISCGSFSTVYKAKDKKNGKFYAIKVCEINQDQVANLMIEALVLSSIKHPHIVRCYEVLFDRNKIIFKLELCDNDLLFFTRKFKPETIRSNASNIVEQLLRALKYLHKKGIVHCDLKPSNIMIKDKKMKICDFNSAKFEKSNLHDTPGCTRWYRAPESITDGIYNVKTDVWSVGCIMYELLTGEVLFQSDNIDEHLEMIYEMVNDLEFDRFESIKGDALDLLTRLLNPEPEKRISIKDSLSHPYIRGKKKKD